jgi:hypothetical protein
MAKQPDTVEMPLTLHVSQAARDALEQRSEQIGTDLSHYVSAIVEQAAKDGVTLDELGGDVQKRFIESGETDEVLSEELERAKHEMRAERR